VGNLIILSGKEKKKNLERVKTEMSAPTLEAIK
jgi:hypothetical protein